MIPRRVLLMGTSPAYFSDNGEPALGDLLERELRTSAPDADWSVTTERLHFAPNTVDRARLSIDRHRPWAVVLILDAGMQMICERVENRVKHRWPWLYPVFRAIGRTSFRLAGGYRRFERPWRNRLLFVMPRYLMHALIGAETDLPQEDVTALTLDTLKVLIEKGLPCICRLSVFPYAPDHDDPTRDDFAGRAQTARDAHTRAVVEFCTAHQIPHYDPLTVSPAHRFEFHQDRLHPSLATRAFEATVLAAMLTPRASRLSHPENPQPVAGQTRQRVFV